MSENQWISFRVGIETYAHSIEYVREIIPYTHPVPVPGAPDETEGILNVRGSVVTIVSAHKLLCNQDIAPSLEASDSRIIILDYEQSSFGIHVDSVQEIVKFDTDAIDYIQDATAQGNITGTCQLGDNLYILCDFENLNTLAEDEDIIK